MKPSRRSTFRPENQLIKLRMLAIVADRFQVSWLESQIRPAPQPGHVGLCHCESPVDALERLDRHRYDVCILSDDFGETAVVRFLRQVRAWGDPLPVILFAAKKNETLAVRALEAGAADYLVRGETNDQTFVRSVRYALSLHRVEQDRKRWVDRYQQLYERGTAGVYRLSSEGTVLECNRALALSLGYSSRSDVVGLQLLHFPGWPDRRTAPLVRNGRPFLGREVCLVRRDGTPLWVRMSDGPLEDEGRNVFEGTLTDISQEREMDRLLQQREAQYLGLLETMSDGMLVLDSGGHVVACNGRAESLIGREMHDLLGQSFFDCFKGFCSENRSQLKVDQLPVYVTLSSGEPMAASVIGFERHDGSSVWASVRTTPVRSPSEGSRGSLIVALRDLSQVKALEEELLQAQKMELMGQIASGTSHDFRNLLTTVSGFAELLSKDEELPEQAKSYSHEIARASRRAIALANRLLGFASHRGLAVKPVALDSVLVEAQPMLERVCSRGVRVLLQLESREAKARIDPIRLEQVVLNLVINARDAVDEDGQIEVRTEALEFVEERAFGENCALPAGRYLRLTVEDNGSGMDEVTKGRIFEPFFTTKSPDKGTGLGLPTVRRIVEGLGGCLAVESWLGVGTRVEVYLPEVSESAISESQA